MSGAEASAFIAESEASGAGLRLMDARLAVSRDESGAVAESPVVSTSRIIESFANNKESTDCMFIVSGFEEVSLTGFLCLDSWDSVVAANISIKMNSKITSCFGFMRRSPFLLFTTGSKAFIKKF